MVMSSSLNEHTLHNMHYPHTINIVTCLTTQPQTLHKCTAVSGDSHTVSRGGDKYSQHYYLYPDLYPEVAVL